MAEKEPEEYSEEALRQILDDDDDFIPTGTAAPFSINQEATPLHDRQPSLELPEDLRDAIENGSADAYLEKYKQEQQQPDVSLSEQIQGYVEQLEADKTPNNSDTTKNRIGNGSAAKTKRSKPRETSDGSKIHLASGIMSLVEIQTRFRSLQINELDLPSTPKTTINAVASDMAKLQDELRIHLSRLGSATTNPARYRKAQDLFDLIDQEITMYQVFIADEGLSLDRILSQIGTDEEEEFRYTPSDAADDSMSDIGASSIPGTPRLQRNFSSSSPLRPTGMTRYDSSPSPSIVKRSFTSPVPPSTFDDIEESEEADAWEIIRWSPLKKLSRQVVGDHAKNRVGIATVMAVSSVIVVGTSRGFVLVFDYKQNLQCILGSDGDFAIDNGAVSALAISTDHSHVAVGHFSGAIYIWDLARPQTASKTIPSITLESVAAGRKEGHIQGATIIHLSFIGIRRALIISADIHGMAFYHSTARVMLVNAGDTVKILGRYPGLSGDFNTPVALKPRRASTVFGLAALPFGQVPHTTDNFGLVALLTPHKMIIVNTRPNAQTQFKVLKPRTSAASSVLSGALAWYPPVSYKEGGKQRETEPRLAYAWGCYLAVLTVHAEHLGPETPDRLAVVNGKKPKQIKLSYKTTLEWQSKDAIVALSWLNSNLIMLFTTSEELVIFDINAKSASDETSVRDKQVIAHDRYTDAVAELDPIMDPSTIPQAYLQSLRVYRGKVFLLTAEGVLVGTLLSWADRVLALMKTGDYLEAISLSTSFYKGTPLQSILNLPDNDQDRQELVGSKLRQLVTSSLNFAFSSEHSQESPDEVSAMLRDLAAACIEAHIAMKDEDTLFDDIYEQFIEKRHKGTFLFAMEPFILEKRLEHIPPAVVQDIVRFYRDRHLLARAEQIICHLDPRMLDIDAILQMCHRESLYDALVFVYSRSLQDYTSPLVEFVALIRRVLSSRLKAGQESMADESVVDENAAMAEYLDPQAQKLYPFLSRASLGLSYPSGESLPDEEASLAKSDLYNFIFSGRSLVWPKRGGKLVLASIDEEEETTYPYLRLFFRFDPKAFLDALDVAFEDSYLNGSTFGDDTGSSKLISRQLIINILLEVVKTDFGPGDISLLHIFISRNVPKYPQFILLSPSMIQRILVSLCSDGDEGTREDRQLAVEYLLSVYTPPDTNTMMQLYRTAKFYRVLEHVYKSSGKHRDLFEVYLLDDQAEEMPSRLQDTLCDRLTSQQRSDVGSFIVSHIEELVEADGEQMADLINSNFEMSYQNKIVEKLRPSPSVLFSYLRGIFERNDVGYPIESESKVDPKMQQDYIALLCEFDPTTVYNYLETHQDAKIDYEAMIPLCEEHDLLDATVFLMSKSGNTTGAFDKVLDITEFRQEEVSSAMSKVEFPNAMTLNDLSSSTRTELDSSLVRLKDVVRTGVKVCSGVTDASAEDLWFNLLDRFVKTTKDLGIEPDTDSDSEDSVTLYVATQLKSAMQEILTSLLLSKSEPPVAFPNLFRRLITAQSGDRTTSSDLRSIFDGMLETYRYEGELLERTNGLYESDLFGSIQGVVKQRVRGWRPKKGSCEICGAPFWGVKATPAVFSAWEQQQNQSNDEGRDDANNILVFRCGHGFHKTCLGRYGEDIDHDDEDSARCILCNNIKKAKTDMESSLHEAQLSDVVPNDKGKGRATSNDAV